MPDIQDTEFVICESCGAWNEVKPEHRMKNSDNCIRKCFNCGEMIEFVSDIVLA